MTELDTETEETIKNWSAKANPNRGKASHNDAVSFLAKFPLGTELTSEEFDQWAQHTGRLNVPPTNAPRNSDAWKAHIQRRHELRYRISNAGSTPGMGSDAFVIDTKTFGHWVIRSPHESFSRTDAAGKIHKLAEHKKKQLRYLMESADWSVLPVYEQTFAEEIFYDIESLEVDIGTRSSRINSKVKRLEMKLRKAIESGGIKPVNHGITALLENRAEDE